MRILLIEDEESIAAVIRRGLEEAHYQVETENNGTDGLRLASARAYALIILDLMLPGIDGWRICSELRKLKINTPILMLTARDTVEDRVRGLETGADDYLPKPFDFTELLARVRALLRRDKVHKTRHIEVADLEIDTAARRVTRSGQEIPLTPREYSLLEALAANEGRVLTREVIQERVWMDEESYSNTVDVHIGTLRRKIDSGFDVKLIHTVHGVGYTLKVTDGRSAA
ncbi:MAG TPA: response regulator transcription factor [Armatimonadota bacterium]|nr:response regulator transcription factor [Armatimonadota bacterium]